MSHAKRAHARFAPSSAHRWVNCTGSVKLCEDIPNKSTPAADEGTAAHQLAEWCLNHDKDPSDHPTMGIVVRPGTLIVVDEEMIEGVRLYVSYVRTVMEQCEFYAIEAKLDLTHIHESMFGTGDFIGYDDENRRLHVVDFKFGRNAVDPERNYQGLAYAIGAAKRYEGRRIDEVYITIVQPRVTPSIRTWTTDARGLRRYTNEFGAAAAAAESAPELVAGDWCRYCPAAAVCPAARDKAHEIARAEFGPQGMQLPEATRMSPAELSKTLSEIDQLEAWAKQVKSFAFAEACEGRVPAGHKLVAKRAVRKWKKGADVIEKLIDDFNLTDDEMFTSKLNSPATIEKLLSKDQKKALAGLWEKVSSGIKLVSENDPGTPVSPAAAEEFANVEIDD